VTSELGQQSTPTAITVKVEYSKEIIMLKNVANQVVGAVLVDRNSGLEYLGAATVSAYLSGDGGAFSLLGTAVSVGGGLYVYTLSAANTNYDLVGVKFVSTDTIAAYVQTWTGPLTANITQVNGQIVDIDDLDFSVVPSPTFDDKQLALTPGDDYLQANNNTIDFTSATFPDLSNYTNAQAKLFVKDLDTGSMVIDGSASFLVSEATKTVKFELVSAATSSISPGTNYRFAVKLEDSSGNIRTIARSKAIFSDNVE
jgi:hypothetical protein